MFGFLNPKPHSLDYRRAYARLCQHHRVNFGVRSLPFHSYEAVFLYQLTMDAGAFSASVMPFVKCCKLSKPTNIHREADAPVGRFCAGVGVLLASIKLEDDVRDAKGFLTRGSRRIAKWVLRGKIRSAREMFAKLDPRFESNIRQLIADHHQLEISGRPISLAEYIEPTANSFGYVFSLASRLSNLTDREQLLRNVGRKVGAALIAFDCAVDWRRDRKRGEFNPLPDENAVAESMVYCLAQLREAESLIRTEVHPKARSATTLARVQQRLLRLDPLEVNSKCKIPADAGQRLMLPVLSTGEPAKPDERPTDEQASVFNVEPDTDGVPPELPGGIENQKKKNESGSSCCGTGSNDCCDAMQCGCISADCCTSIGCEGCCAVAECGDCSC